MLGFEYQADLISFSKKTGWVLGRGGGPLSNVPEVMYNMASLRNIRSTQPGIS